MLVNLSTQHLRNAARQQSVVGCADRQFHVPDLQKRPVEPTRHEALEGGALGSVLPNTLNDVSSAVPHLKKLGNQFWWMLEISVQHDDRFATTLIYSGDQGELVPEASGHYQNLDPRIDARDFCNNG